MNTLRVAGIVSVFALLTPGLIAQPVREVAPLKNWPAPLYWQPTPAETEVAGPRRLEPRAATPVGSLVFVAMTPCRVVDTRSSQGFPSPFGTPSLSPYPSAIRTFPIQSSTNCSIPSTSQAYSFNVTIIPNPLGASVGYVTIYPTAGSPNTPPNAVTLDDITGDIRNNAAIVPAGITNGSVSVVTNGTGPDLVIDINGYYAPSTGITLGQGTASAPSLSFAGDPGTGIFSSQPGSLSLTTGGITALTVDPMSGDLEVPGSIRKGGTLFLHNLGTNNTAVGINALAPTSSGTANTATGSQALTNNTSGSSDTSSGYQALFGNTSGSNNTAHGYQAMFGNTTGGLNTASGVGALFSNLTGGSNTASGAFALNNTTGNNNTALGASAGGSITSGNNNTALGINAGANITTGSNNIDIGSGGLPGDGTAANSGVIRIGGGTQTSFFAAGIAGVPVSNQATVLINTSTGQLGTVNSSQRYKEDIEDMAGASSGLLKLRPVTFRYKQPYADGSRPLDYGLIAEEVAEVYPDLVSRNAEGQIETVQYHKLPAMLLSELQKEHETNQSQAAALRKQDETLASLQAQVASLQQALETLLSRDRALAAK